MTEKIAIGFDWDEEGGWYAAIGDNGVILETGEVTSSPNGLTTLLGIFNKYRDPATGNTPPLIIETTRRPLFRAVHEQGIEVLGINPATLHGKRATRKKTKSDKNDAVALGRRFRLDETDFYPLQINSDDGYGLTLLARTEKDSAIRAQQAAGRTRSLLAEFYPAPLGCWSATAMADSTVAATVLLAAPNPQAGQALTLDDLVGLIRSTGKVSHIQSEADKAFEALQRTFLGYPAGMQAQYEDALGTLAGSLRNAVTEHNTLEKTLFKAVKAHPYYDLIGAATGAGPKVVARLVAEMGDDPDRFLNVDMLAAFAGTSPVDSSSHKSQQFVRRDVKGNRLHRAFWDWSDIHRQYNAAAMEFYWNHRIKGDGHPTTIRKIAYKLTIRTHYCISRGVVWDDNLAWNSDITLEAAKALRDEGRKILERRNREGRSRPLVDKPSVRQQRQARPPRGRAGVGLVDGTEAVA